ncbi:MAG: hypothetical protein WC779_07890 [Candidatus Omnitrophota bacterium]|jgi:hypothetical protein
MKICPKCGQTYDDTWTVCLKDESKLIIAEKTASELPDLIPTNLFFSNKIDGRYGGLYFSAVVNRPYKSQEYYLISFDKESSLKLRIYNKRSSFLNKLLYSEWGLAIVNNADEFFGRDSLIYANDPLRAMDYLNNASRRTVVKNFFDIGFNVFSIDGKRVSIRKDISYSGNMIDEEQCLKDRIERLFLLTNGI